MLAPVDRFLERHRIPVIGGTVLVAVAGLPLLYLPARSTSIRSTCEARRSSRSRPSSICEPIPNIGANAINVVLPNSDNVDKVADQLRKIPEVDQVSTLQDFVPGGQERKLTLIRGLARQLQTPLSTEDSARPPDDAQTVAALKGTADTLTRLASKASGPGADAANRLAASLTKLADADKAKRDAAETAFIVPLRVALDEAARVTCRPRR